MSFRRDSSPPRGPRADSGASYFTSDKWIPPPYHRERSRSRSPRSDHRRPSERDDSYNYAKEVRQRSNENYRPKYDETPTRPSVKDHRRPSSIGSGHSSPPSNDFGPPTKPILPSRLGKPQEARAKASVEAPASVTRSKPAHSWQDRAMNAPVSLPAATTLAAKMPQLSEEALAEATQALGGIFKQLINEATTMSALKSQQHAAKKRAEKRISEYEKSKGHHDKFPSIKEAQTTSKADAEKDLKTISDKVIEKQSSLKELAIDAAEKLIPTLLARSGKPSEDESLKERVDSLESTCKRLERLFEDQKALLAETIGQCNTDQATVQSLDKKHSALEKEFKGAQVKWIEDAKKIQTRLDTVADRAKVEEVLQTAKNSKQAIESLTTDLSTTKEHIARISSDSSRLSSDLKVYAEKIATIPTLAEDIANLRKELKSIEATSHTAFSQAATTRDTGEQIKALNDKLNKVKEQNSGLVAHTTELAKAQRQFRETWAELEGRVNDLSSRLDPASFETRIQELEKPKPRDGSESITKDLEALKDRVKQIERTPPPAHPLPAKANSKSLDARVEALEKAGSSENGAKLEGRLKGVEVEISLLRSTNFADIKKRVSAVESQQQRSSVTLSPNPQASSAAISASVQPQIDEISSQIQSIQESLEEVKVAQEVHDETWTETLIEKVQEESQTLQARISSLEAKSSELSSSLENRLQSSFNNATIVNEATSKVVEIFKTNPDLLPLMRQPGPGPALDDFQKATIINEAITNVVTTFTAKPDLLPYPNFERITLVLNQALVPIYNSIEATNLSLGNLQSRVDNINTLDLSKHALGQLYELHPDLGNIEASMTGLKADVARHDRDIQNKNLQVEVLSKDVKALQVAIQNASNAQDHEKAEAMTQQYHQLRREVDSLTDDGVSISRKVKALAEHLDKAAQGVADLRQENETNKKTIAEKFGDLQGNIDDKMDKSPQVSRSEAPPRPSPTMSHRSNQSHRSNSNGQNNTNRGSRPSSSSIANRQPSVSSVNSNNKKRKLDNAPSTKTNGIRPTSGSPRAKKRKAFGEDDPDADPDYNEDIPEPGVSTDEDIKKPLRKENFTVTGNPKAKEKAKVAKAPEAIDLISDSE